MIRLIAPLTAAFFLTACATTPSGPSASAQLMAITGNAVTGRVQFTQKGDCSSGDGISAGGHFNPDGKAHGAHDQSEHHAGDLPSLKADASGTARFSFQSGTLSIGSGKADVLGRGLIVHRDPDDYKTQPTGNSGPRLACGVIAST